MNLTEFKKLHNITDGTVVYGCSDDLVEIEGDIEDEVSQYGTDEAEHGVLLKFSDRTLLEVKYGKNDWGVWEVKVLQLGNKFIKIIPCDDEDAHVYSDVAVFKPGLTGFKRLDKMPSILEYAKLLETNPELDRDNYPVITDSSDIPDYYTPNVTVKILETNYPEIPDSSNDTVKAFVEYWQKNYSPVPPNVSHYHTWKAFIAGAEWAREQEVKVDVCVNRWPNLLIGG